LILTLLDFSLNNSIENYIYGKLEEVTFSPKEEKVQICRCCCRYYYVIVSVIIFKNEVLIGELEEAK
jgi:hypothetical protein